MSNFYFKLRLNRIFIPHTKNTIEKLRLNPKLRKSGHLSNHGHPGPSQCVPRVCSNNLKTPRNKLISTPRTLSAHYQSLLHHEPRYHSVQTTLNPSGQPFDLSVQKTKFLTQKLPKPPFSSFTQIFLTCFFKTKHES